MTKKILLVALAAMLLSSTGCEIARTEYLSITPHDEQYDIDEHSSALVVDNYMGMKNAILSFVETREPYGVIRIYEYADGDVQEDLEAAVYEICRSDPLGVYTVLHMSHDCILIASYYEIHIYTTFSKTEEQMQDVTRVGGMSGLRSPLTAALSEADPQIAVRISSYSPIDYNDLAWECYRGDPVDVVCIPEISASVYPNNGVQRVVELNLDYGITRQELKERQRVVRGALELLTQLLRTERVNVPLRICTELGRVIENKTEQTSALLYDLLCGNDYSDESLVIAMAQLCDLANIDNEIVWGEKNGAAYCWNLVVVDNVWYHLDTAEQTKGTGNGLRLDNDMAGYSWDRMLYPDCNGEPVQELDPLEALLRMQGGADGGN